MNRHLVCIGGVDHALRIPFLTAVQEHGFQVTAISTGDEVPFLRSKIAHVGYDFGRFLAGGRERAAIERLRALVDELHPDLVQSFDTKPNLLTAFATHGRAPLVRTINGLGWVFSSNQASALALRPVFCGLQRLAASWTSATVFQNNDDHRFFKTWGLLGLAPSLVIPGSGIDPCAFEKARREGPRPDDLRRQLGLGSAQVIAFVGRLTRQKGVMTLLRAAQQVVQKRENVVFLLIGPRESEGPFAIAREVLDSYAPYVVPLGARSDIPSLLAIADVFAFPTEYREGVPRVLLEAGLSGLPIVAARMPGCVDVVRDSWNGYLVAPRDPVALAARILELLANRDRAAAMGRRSIALIKSQFELSSIVEAYCDLYDDVLGAADLTAQAAYTRSDSARARSGRSSR